MVAHERDKREGRSLSPATSTHDGHMVENLTIRSSDIYVTCNDYIPDRETESVTICEHNWVKQLRKKNNLRALMNGTPPDPYLFCWETRIR